MVEVITERKLALDSLDYLDTLPAKPKAGGAVTNNSKNIKFNRLLNQLMKRRFSLLDLGCSGGGFVEDCLSDGNFAVGLEGTDWSQRVQRAAWATITNNLFVCDIARQFQILVDGNPKLFDIVTAWEVMEHIPAHDLSIVCQNVKKHLQPAGLWIMSISMLKGSPHQTVLPRKWWIEFFINEGFYSDEKLISYFGNKWIRGPAQGDKDSFHIVLKKC